jgi:lipopolysaccharide transport system permease protein
MNSLVDVPEKCERAAGQAPPLEETAPAPQTVIRPARGWQLINVRELWQFRELIYFLTWRDVKIRYKQTLLGAAWAVLQPAMMMVVFTIFFAQMAKVSSGDVPYPLFVYAGLLPWTFFATAIANSANSVVGSERLITKIYFPRLAIPMASVGAAVVDFGIAFGLLLVLMLWYGIAPGLGMLLIPVVFAAMLLAALGVGTLLSALNVAYRDFRYVVPFLVQLWMFATPTVYMQPADPEAETGAVQLFLALNPMTGLIAVFRAACLGGPIPWIHFGLSSAFVAGVFLAGCFYFRKVEDSFADII